MRDGIRTISYDSGSYGTLRNQAIRSFPDTAYWATSAPLHEGDVLLMVDDDSRQGALRFAEQLGGPFLNLNPVPTDLKPHILCTAIDVEDPTASLDLALAVA